MPQNYDYIKLIGIIVIIAGFLKIIIGFLGYSFGEHYLSSFLIILIGLIVYLVGFLIKRNNQVS